MNRATIYARLSLADEKSTSTKRQEKDCRDHAKSLGLEVVEVFVDEGISGYKDDERPAFDEAIEALVRGDFDTLIATRPISSRAQEWRVPVRLNSAEPESEFLTRRNWVDYLGSFANFHR
jgi:hypothetical protein